MKKPFAEYKAFKGENTVSDSLALKKGEVQSALDIDFDIDRGGHRKQLGSVLALAGIYDNIWSNGTIMLATDSSGDLLRIFEDLTTEVLRSDVGTAPMSYVDPAGIGVIYYSNKIVIGYVKHGVSYVMGSTSIRDKIDTFPMYPIEYFGNRLWGFVDNVLWRTDPDELFYFNRITEDEGFYQRKGTGTLLKAVKDGLYIADGSHHFIRNAGRKEEEWDWLCSYDAIPNTATQDPVDLEVFYENTEQVVSGKGHIWITDKGFRFGLSGGISGNLSRKQIVMPDGIIRGASLHISNDERFNRFIVSLTN